MSYFYHLCIHFIIVVDFIYFVLFELFETLFFFYKIVIFIKTVELQYFLSIIIFLSHFYHICINFIIVFNFIYFVLFELFETLFFFLQNCNFYKNSRITVFFEYNYLFEPFLSHMYSFYYCSWFYIFCVIWAIWNTFFFFTKL